MSSLCVFPHLVPVRPLLLSLFVHVLILTVAKGPALIKNSSYAHLPLHLQSLPHHQPSPVPEPLVQVAKAPKPLPGPQHSQALVSKSAHAPNLPPAQPLQPSQPSPANVAEHSAPMAGANLAASPSPDNSPNNPLPQPNPHSVADISHYGAVYSRWLAEHRSYPRIARMRGWQGQVGLRVYVARKGAVLNVEITHSSGYDILDREAQAMVRRADPLPELPLSLVEREFTVDVPVVFRLEQPS